MKKKVMAVLLICTLVATQAMDISALEMSEDKVDKQGYNNYMSKSEEESLFLVDIEDAEWSDFSSHDEMLEACTIPEDELKTMETKELLKYVLDYPLMIDLLAYDSWNEGLQALSEDFNGLAELLSREDGADCLLEAYANLEISDKSKDTSIEEVLETEMIEAALSQEEVLENLSDNQLEELGEIAEEKYNDKRENEMYNSFEASLYENMYENDTLDSIDAEVVMSEDESGLCSRNIILHTAKGTPVSAIMMDEPLSKEQIKLINKQYKKAYPKATYVSSATGRYNCHSYAWYKSSSNNSVWINFPKAFITEAKTVKKSKVKSGNKAVWINAAANAYYIHSGVVYSVKNGNVTIQSKWGKAPLMRHAQDYSPYGKTTVKYYK